jgi:hypothetical protein
MVSTATRPSPVLCMASPSDGQVDDYLLSLIPAFVPCPSRAGRSCSTASCRLSPTLHTTCSLVCANQAAATHHLLDVLHERP